MKRVSTKDVRDLELWLMGREKQELDLYMERMKLPRHWCEINLGAAEAINRSRAFEEALAKLRNTFALPAESQK